MQRTPPPQLPPRPPLTVGIYKTLPDASNADLPPKPAITPTSLSPTSFQFPQVAVTSSSNKPLHGRKRKYSHSNDSIVVPLQYYPAQDGINNATYHSAGHEGVGEGETAERAVKVRRKSSNSTIVDRHKNSNDDATCEYHQPSLGMVMHQQFPDMTRSETPRVKLQLIHDMLLGGAETLTTRDQDYLVNRLHENLACISAMMMWLVAKQVTNKTYNLSYGIIHWAHNNSKLELMEYMLTDRLYAFDIEGAFDEGLMGIKEVMDLMDCQLVLRCVRMERKKRPEGAHKKSAERPETSSGLDADHCESDTGSADMDLSEEDC
ncbi:hypothetical protein F4782DRAFT_546202 [Xylaria castorea]|nr:hypothetical protein F4782DRAFT_546202 [Xylaria castorea]